MGQTKIMSAIETITNYVIGFVLAWTVALTIFPLMGYDIALGHAAIATLTFTVVSVIRSYIVRRFFNYMMVKNNATNRC